MDIEDQVRRGVLQHGDRIPSVRQMSQHHKLSITTVIHAYFLLESKALLKAVPNPVSSFVPRRMARAARLRTSC
jgi:DNA-binding transcriptional regulator YhcF (GntR family)